MRTYKQQSYPLYELPLVHLFSVWIGLEILFAAFYVLGPKQVSPDMLAEFTAFARSVYQPERDQLIYVVGCMLIPLAAFLAEAYWRRNRVESAASEDVSIHAKMALKLLRCIAFLLVIIIPGALYLISASMAFGQRDGVALAVSPDGALVALIRTGVLIGLQIALWHLVDRMTKPDATLTKRLVLLITPLLTRCLPNANAIPSETATAADSPSWRRVFDLGFCLVLLLVILVPDTHRLMGSVYLSDLLHHWNYFVMAPLAGFGSGKALGTEVYAQYGLGWPVLIEALRPILPLSYASAAQVLVTATGFYFVAIYFFLCHASGSRRLAVIGTLTALGITQFTGMAAESIWVFPSSTPSRHPLDAVFFLLLLVFVRLENQGKTFSAVWCWLATALCAAVALFFETDTGVYLLVATGAFLLARSPLFGPNQLPRPGLSLPVLAVLFAATFAIVLMACLSLASRGTVFTAEFWLGWMEWLRFYSSGISLLPISPNAEVTVPAFLFFCSYFSLLCGPASRFLRRDRQTRELDALKVALAIYGLCSALIFVGRSHPANLSHCAIPLILLATICMGPPTLNFLDQIMAGLSGRHRIGNWATKLHFGFGLMIAAIVLAFAVQNRYLFWHPSLLRSLLPFSAPNFSSLWGFQNNIPPDTVYSRQPDALPDIILPASEQQRTTAFDETAHVVRAYKQKGANIAIVSNEDTTLYIATDVQPWGRYSPVLPLLLRWHDVSVLKQKLSDRVTAPDVIFLVSAEGLRFSWPDTSDVAEELRRYIATEYSRVGTAGDYEVYERRDAAPPSDAENTAIPNDAKGGTTITSLE